MRYFAAFLVVLAFIPTAARANTPAPGSYSCAVSEIASVALDGAVAGKADMQLALDAGSFSIPSLGLSGTVDVAGSSDGTFKEGVGSFFAESQGHMLKTSAGLALGRAAFSTDASGVPIAYLAMYGGTYHLVCYEAQAKAANLTGEPAPASGQPPVKTEAIEPENLTDEQKLELNFATAPEQKGKEIELFGKSSLMRPDEGHYACKATNYFSDGETRTNDMIDSDDDHTGFDLFADGSVRLKRTDGKFEESGNAWRHNPGNGVVLFAEGTLSVYFKWPIHVRKKLSEALPEVSILYITDYDYDGPLDDMTLCIFSGPPQSKSPKAEIAERAQKNLNPPPPGTPVKAAGLYYRQQWVTQMGFGTPPQMYQEDYYYYRYFQDNGYVWLESPPDDGDFEKLGCNKPMVDGNGEPTCTTYSIEDGLLSKPTIRIGHDAPVPFEEDDGTVSVDSTGYSIVQPKEDLKLDKFVRYFSYNGISSREGSITFRADGTYESTSWSGVSFTTEIPDVSRTTVVSSNPGEDLKGTYKIDGHTLTFTTNSGKVAKVFFGYLSDGFFMVGGQPYFEPSE
jgi:hypothetical protein